MIADSTLDAALSIRDRMTLEVTSRRSEWASGQQHEGITQWKQQN
jgi:hypothetical protein